ncbi:uncharacterized protein N7484_009405 [Penicillium longicatenatum]|uniref:uncharacterized protein n=1 Tax=Penicillium longicatenatum TaxID=1561947 RepID=UPI002549551E|nr:uncharacterized protein N7484_009405 [Penicillium longicatenatum]KAJ5636092.1 hypothetical protein N7484_009405 [Penicillium longicatenatum]
MFFHQTHASTDADTSARSLPRAIVCHDGELPKSAVYGPTATLMLLDDINKLLPLTEASEAITERPHKRARLGNSESESFGSLGLADGIYEASRIQNTGNFRLRENVANKHLDSFFEVVHSIYPIIPEDTFRGIWLGFWDSPLPAEETTGSLQWQCLMHSVLALGALYMNTPQDAKWAAGYFVEAQKLIWSLFDGARLLTVQASMLMAVYAHHTSQPNVAYNYLGVAIRFAYTLGINDMNVPMPDGVEFESAVSLWWSIYSLESDICLEYGRALSIRERDAKAPYPSEEMSEDGENFSKFVFITVMAKFGRILRKVIDLASDISERKSNLQSFVGRLMNHQAELMTWRGELPAHLAPKDIAPTGDPQAWDEIPWAQHQRCEIELR